MAPNLYHGQRTPGEDDKETNASMGSGRSCPEYVPDQEQYLVAFDEAHDPLNPQDWTTWRKSVPQCIGQEAHIDIISGFTYRRLHAVAHLWHVSTAPSLPQAKL